MKKLLKFNLAVRSSIAGGQPLLKVAIRPADVRDWLLCLHLLHDHHIEACVFGSDENGSKLEIRLGESCEWRVGSQAGHFILSLTNCGLDYMRSFFARYYRDGVAEVDHIDFETDEPRMGYIIVTVDESAAPVSSDEVKRILGIE